MKKILCAMVCVISSLLYAAEHPRDQQNSNSKMPSYRTPLVTKSGPKLDSDPANSNPLIQRVRSQSQDTHRFMLEENLKSKIDEEKK